MKWFRSFFIFVFLMGISACSTNTSISSTSTSQPIIEPSSTLKSIASATLEVTLTRTIQPSPTPNLVPPQPNIGDIFWQWGGDSNTYQVWINNLELMCHQWICPDNNSNHMYNDSWTYIGQARGDATFTFPFPAKDIVITWGGVKKNLHLTPFLLL